MKSAQIRSVAAYLPKGRLDNKELAQVFSNWTEEKITRKLGIVTRPIADKNETAVDLGVLAGERLFASGIVKREEIDFLVFCTQSPDYFLPTSACLIHERLGLRQNSGAFDLNLGCSGYVYGLAVCKGLIESGVAQKVLFITAETYSKYINEKDRVTRPLFGDGAAATLIEGVERDENANVAPLDFFEFGTCGKGANMLIVQAGASRTPSTPETAIPFADALGSFRSKDQLFMHGPGIFAFSIEVVPPLVKRLQESARAKGATIDAYVFHQANKFMLDRLRDLCEIDPRLYFNNVETRGNTVSSSIPIALIDATRDELIKPGKSVALVGFGVGLSWGVCLARLAEDFEVVPLE